LQRPKPKKQKQKTENRKQKLKLKLTPSYLQCYRWVGGMAFLWLRQKKTQQKV